MGISKITRNFQVTIPKEVREVKSLREGDKVIFSIEGNRVDITKLEKNIISETAGLWKIKETGQEYERRVRRAWGARQKA